MGAIGLADEHNPSIFHEAKGIESRRGHRASYNAREQLP
jgi:hypothetical protein